MTDEKTPVQVPRKVFEGIEAVRCSGETNMINRPMVARLAFDKGFYAAAIWLEEHHDEYAHAVFNGFKVIEDEPPG